MRSGVVNLGLRSQESEPYGIRFRLVEMKPVGRVRSPEETAASFDAASWEGDKKGEGIFACVRKSSPVLVGHGKKRHFYLAWRMPEYVFPAAFIMEDCEDRIKKRFCLSEVLFMDLYVLGQFFPFLFTLKMPVEEILEGCHDTFQVMTMEDMHVSFTFL